MPNETENSEVTILFTSPKELEQTLFALTQPDNENLKKATLLMNEFMEEPKSILCLIQQLESSQKSEVRQVAAVYLREQIEVFWKKVPNNIKQKLKKFLIEKLFSVKERAERLAIASITVSTAKCVLAKEGWKELLEALEKASQKDAPVEFREAAFIIWRNIVQFCGGSLKKHFGKMLTILTGGLQDPQSQKVQVESVKAIGAMVEFLEHQKEVEILENVIPQMVNVIDQCLKKGDEQNVCDGIEVFIDLVDSRVPVLKKHGVELTKFMIKIATAKDKLPMTVRKQAVNYMTWMCKSKPKLVIKYGYTQQFLALAVNLVMESETIKEDDEEDLKNADEKEFTTPLGIACDLMDEIFLNLPSEICFPLGVKAIQQLVSEAEPRKRKSAYVMMTMMVEGCMEIILKGDNLAILLKSVINGIKDEDMSCRKAAFEALGQFCTHLPDDVIKYHKLMLPEIFKTFERNDENIRVTNRALNALEMLIDCFDEHSADEENDFKIENYLEQIMSAIGKCLASKNKSLQVQAVATLASTAASSGKAFVKYLPQVLGLLDQLLKIEDEKQLELRAEATQCLGAVAVAAGRENYGPHLLKYHELIMKGVTNFNHSSLRESTFMYFSELSQVMGPEVFKLETFDDMFALCLGTIADNDGLAVELPDDGFGEAVPKGFLDGQDKLDEELEDEEEDIDELKLEELGDEELEKLIKEAAEGEDDDDEEDVEDDEMEQAVGQMKALKLNVTTGFMQEKAAAIHSLSQFIAYGGFEFFTYIEEAWEQIIGAWEYPHALVKLALAGCIHELLVLITRYSLNDKPNDRQEVGEIWHYKWEQGNDNYEWGPKIEEWIENIFPLYIEAIIDEEDKDTLSYIVDHFNAELRMLGPKSIKKYMEALMKAISSFYNEKTACHANSDVENEETEDVATRHKYVTDVVAETLGTLAELWGAKFVPVFEKIYPTILKWSKPNRHPHDQAMAVGCVADVATKLTNAGEGLMSKIADSAFKTALRVAQSEDNNTRQNALYCIGALFLTSNQEANLSHSQNCLRCINTYMKFPKDGSHGEQQTRDNAVSALGKVLMSETDSLPFDKLFPAFLQSLPLTADFSEYYWIYRVLIYLVNEKKEKIKKYLPQILTAFANGLQDKNVVDKTKQSISECVKELCKDKNIQQLVEKQLSANQQQVIMRCCQ